MRDLDRRKTQLINILRRDKFSTCGKISVELEVSNRTVTTDLQYLKTIYPQIRTTSGRYNGGIYWDEK